MGRIGVFEFGEASALTIRGGSLLALLGVIFVIILAGHVLIDVSLAEGDGILVLGLVATGGRWLSTSKVGGSWPSVLVGGGPGGGRCFF